MVSTRTKNRRKKIAILMQIGFTCISAAGMEKRNVAKIDMWELRRIFTWLHEHPEIKEIVKKNFYSLDKNKKVSMLIGEEKKKEEALFN